MVGFVGQKEGGVKVGGQIHDVEGFHQEMRDHLISAIGFQVNEGTCQPAAGAQPMLEPNHLKPLL